MAEGLPLLIQRGVSGDLHGHPVIAVPGDLLHDVHRRAEVQQQRDAGVAKIMEAQILRVITIPSEPPPDDDYAAALP